MGQISPFPLSYMLYKALEIISLFRDKVVIFFAVVDLSFQIFFQHISLADAKGLGAYHGACPNMIPSSVEERGSGAEAPEAS